jgi:hypothetical protein
MLPAEELRDLPSPARAAIESSRAAFLRVERGHIRDSNDVSADYRLRHFANWLGVKGYDKQSTCIIPQSLGLDLIGAYLSWVRQGNSLPSNSKGPIGKLSSSKLRHLCSPMSQPTDKAPLCGN